MGRPIKNDLTLEKLKIDQRLKDIEAYIIEGKLLRIQIKEIMDKQNIRIDILENSIEGKGESKGIRDRVNDLESEDTERKKIKDGFLKVAVGSITMAVGASVLWICKLIWNTAGK